MFELLSSDAQTLCAYSTFHRRPFQPPTGVPRIEGSEVNILCLYSLFLLYIVFFAVKGSKNSPKTWHPRRCHFRKSFLNNLLIYGSCMYCCIIRQVPKNGAKKDRTPAIQQASGRSNLLFSSIPAPQQAISSSCPAVRGAIFFCRMISFALLTVRSLVSKSMAYRRSCSSLCRKV